MKTGEQAATGDRVTAEAAATSGRTRTGARTENAEIGGGAVLLPLLPLLPLLNAYLGNRSSISATTYVITAMAATHIAISSGSSLSTVSASV